MWHAMFPLAIGMEEIAIPIAPQVAPSFLSTIPTASWNATSVRVISTEATARTSSHLTVLGTIPTMVSVRWIAMWLLATLMEEIAMSLAALRDAVTSYSSMTNAIQSAALPRAPSTI